MYKLTAQGVQKEWLCVKREKGMTINVVFE